MILLLTVLLQIIQSSWRNSILRIYGNLTKLPLFHFELILFRVIPRMKPLSSLSHCDNKGQSRTISELSHRWSVAAVTFIYRKPHFLDKTLNWRLESLCISALTHKFWGFESTAITILKLAPQWVSICLVLKHCTIQLINIIVFLLNRVLFSVTVSKKDQEKFGKERLAILTYLRWRVNNFTIN